MTTSKADEAYASFTGGFSCSQAVLASFSEELGMDKETAYKISCGFGAGIARSGNICGAVSGALMVIGLMYGKTTPEDNAARETTYSLMQEFLKEYTALHGSVMCPDLLGYDMRDPARFAEAKEKKVAARLCPGLTRDAVIVLEKVLAAHR
jgi:C_GCAxxG_C_C family probable redox protein